jgi:hypothetical protein
MGLVLCGRNNGTGRWADPHLCPLLRLTYIFCLKHQGEVLRRARHLQTLPQKSKSKSHCDWRSVSQYVLVSSPNMGLLTRDFFFESYILVIFVAPSLTRVGSVMCQSLSLKSTVVSDYLLPQKAEGWVFILQTFGLAVGLCEYSKGNWTVSQFQVT